MTLKPLIALFALVLTTPVLAASADWRTDASKADAARLADLDGAWTTALRQIGEDGRKGDLAKLGVLADRKARLARPHPAPGTYRCRTVKLGRMDPAASSLTAYGWFRCKVDLSPGGDLSFAKITGSQRPAGFLYPRDAKRLVYVGAVAWGDEPPAVYGADPERDQIGQWERIGPQRWRLALPWPRQESVLDLIEVAR